MSASDRIIPVALREGVYAYLDLPFDLTPEEAAKIARVVKAFAIPSNESPQSAGGHAAAASMTPEQRTARARKAADARWKTA